MKKEKSVHSLLILRMQSTINVDLLDSIKQMSQLIRCNHQNLQVVVNKSLECKENSMRVTYSLQGEGRNAVEWKDGRTKWMDDIVEERIHSEIRSDYQGVGFSHAFI